MNMSFRRWKRRCAASNPTSMQPSWRIGQRSTRASNSASPSISPRRCPAPIQSLPNFLSTRAPPVWSWRVNVRWMKWRPSPKKALKLRPLYMGRFAWLSQDAASCPMRRMAAPAAAGSATNPAAVNFSSRRSAKAKTQMPNSLFSLTPCCRLATFVRCPLSIN